MLLVFCGISYLGFRSKWHVTTGEHWIWCILAGIPFYFLVLADPSAFPKFFLLSMLFLSYMNGARLRTTTGKLPLSLIAGIPLLGLPVVAYALFIKTPAYPDFPVVQSVKKDDGTDIDGNDEV